MHKKVLLGLVCISLIAGGVIIYRHLGSIYRTQFANQVPRIEECLDRAELIKNDATQSAQALQFEEALSQFGRSREFYEYCDDFFPTGVSAFFNKGDPYNALQKIYWENFLDLFFKFALIQQDEEYKDKNLDLSIGAMSRALEALNHLCTIEENKNCGNRKQSYLTILGDAYRIKKEYSKALDMFEEADDANPGDSANLSFWGLTLMENGKKNEAFKKWELALKKDPSAPAGEMMKEYK